ncbi:hypothetical protein QBC36DRAFT_130288 [Triangularia setosa]|uniref:Uncharacterized protein n=1 Tax=Triangularia setosa TaxID=2587417 RepID=A0AAN6W9L0_9PEZI|nr:hypothetical protein QBC36DRAFT_130288 [Podospora setosa]
MEATLWPSSWRMISPSRTFFFMARIWSLGMDNRSWCMDTLLQSWRRQQKFGMLGQGVTFFLFTLFILCFILFSGKYIFEWEVLMAIPAGVGAYEWVLTREMTLSKRFKRSTFVRGP